MVRGSERFQHVIASFFPRFYQLCSNKLGGKSFMIHDLYSIWLSEGLNRPWWASEESTEGADGPHILHVLLFPNPFILDNGYYRICGQGSGFRGTLLVQQQYDFLKMELFYNNNGIAATYMVCPEGLRWRNSVQCTVEIDPCYFRQVSFFSKWAFPLISRTDQHLDPTAVNTITSMWLWTIIKTHEDFMVLTSLQLTSCVSIQQWDVASFPLQPLGVGHLVGFMAFG